MKFFFVLHGILLAHALIALWCKNYFGLSWEWPLAAFLFLAASLVAYFLTVLFFAILLGGVFSGVSGALGGKKK